MRIGIDCRLWNESGVGRYIRNLVGQLHVTGRNNQYVLFVLTKDRKKILKQVQNDNFGLARADMKWHTIGEQLKFPSILNKHNLDLVHFPYISVPIFYNKPFVVTIHDLIPYHFPTGEASTLPSPLYQLKQLGYKFVISQAAKKAKKIITVSNATKREIIDHLKVDPYKVVVTYEGVDDKITNHKSQITNNSQNTKYKILDTKYFLYVGNAYPHKNLNRLIQAFVFLCHPEFISGSKFKQDYDIRQNDKRLVLVGKEDYFYRRLKEKVKKMDLQESVLFYGEASDEELVGLYKNARALVMPSFMEGFGLPALEAMVNKCLVLASDIPAIREICKDAAIYFDPYDSSDIKNKMEKVLLNDSNHFTDRIKKALEQAKMFSWKKVAEEILHVYNSLMKSN